MTRGTPRAAKKWPRSLCWKKYSKSDLLRKIVDTSWAHPTVKKSPGEPTTCFLGVFAMKIANTSGSKNQKCQKPETRNQKTQKPENPETRKPRKPRNPQDLNSYIPLDSK